MKKLTTDFLKTNPTGTACGLEDNIALSNGKLIDFIDKYFGSEIFVNEDWDDVYDGYDTGICEVRAKVHRVITKDEVSVFCDDMDLKDFLEDMFDCKIKNMNLNDLYLDCPTSNGINMIGFIFMWLIGELGGSVRFEDGYLDEDDMLFFEVE